MNKNDIELNDRLSRIVERYEHKIKLLNTEIDYWKKAYWVLQEQIVKGIKLEPTKIVVSKEKFDELNDLFRKEVE